MEMVCVFSPPLVLRDCRSSLVQYPFIPIESHGGGRAAAPTFKPSGELGPKAGQKKWLRGGEKVREASDRLLNLSVHSCLLPKQLQKIQRRYE